MDLTFLPPAFQRFCALRPSSKSLGTTDVSNAAATMPEDKISIMNQIARAGGAENVNRQVGRKIKEVLAVVIGRLWMEDD
mmetsp:Transcript_6747/g.14564  ORF Transcript_6747/g.14564 Transcript_6747/m.14564 type:complete len:80 (-) Transcript_6747:168-407(-)